VQGCEGPWRHWTSLQRFAVQQMYI
jgi:hypothetical protein